MLWKKVINGKYGEEEGSGCVLVRKEMLMKSYLKGMRCLQHEFFFLRVMKVE